MLLEMFLEREARVVGSQGDAALRRGAGRFRRLGGLLHEIKHRVNPLLDLVPAVGVSLVGAADGVADVLLEVIQRVVEFPQQKSLLQRLRKKGGDRIHMAVGHSENIIRLLHQFARQMAAAPAGNVYAQLAQRPHRMGARRLPLQGADAGRACLEILAAPDGVGGRGLPPSGCGRHCRCIQTEWSSFLPFALKPCAVTGESSTENSSSLRASLLDDRKPL